MFMGSKPATLIQVHYEPNLNFNVISLGIRGTKMFSKDTVGMSEVKRFVV